MDYEQFSQDVTATAAAKRAVDEFAKKQVDGLHICPRCGAALHASPPLRSCHAPEKESGHRTVYWRGGGR